jgi:hypothetical protein
MFWLLTIVSSLFTNPYVVFTIANANVPAETLTATTVCMHVPIVGSSLLRRVMQD